MSVADIIMVEGVIGWDNLGQESLVVKVNTGLRFLKPDERVGRMASWALKNKQVFSIIDVR